MIDMKSASRYKPMARYNRADALLQRLIGAGFVIAVVVIYLIVYFADFIDTF